MGLEGSLQMPQLGDSDIRPDALMHDQADLFRSDVARLVANSHDFVEVPCPACAGSTTTRVFEKMGFHYVRCSNCRTMFTSPRPTPAHLRTYYETSENYRYWASHIFPASEPARRERIFRPRVERILGLCTRHSVETDTLVEVGPGFGTFCEEMLATGRFRQVLAIEPTPGLAESCRNRGITVLEQPVEEVDIAALPEVNVVASFEAIEHLFEPIAFVQSCFEILAPGGLLVLTCPNGEGFEVQELGVDSDTVDAEHLNYFNPTSLAHLVQRAGFVPLEVSTPGRLDADLVRKRAADGRWDAGRSPFLRRVLVEEWDRLGEAFQDFLASHNLSSHMWLVACKPNAESV